MNQERSGTGKGVGSSKDVPEQRDINGHEINAQGEVSASSSPQQPVSGDKQSILLGNLDTTVSEELLSSTLDSVSDMVFLHDAEYSILHANQAYIQRAGLSLEEMTGKPYWEVFPQGDGPLPGCRHAREQGEGQETDEVELETGEIFLSRNFAIADNKGHYHHSLHVLVDITKQHHIQAERDLLSEALRQAAEGAAIFDSELNITYVNPAFCRILQRQSEELIGQNMSTFIPEEQSHRIPVIRETVESNGVWSGEGLFEAADGSLIPMYFTASKIQDKKGSKMGYVGTYLDLRELNMARSHLNALRGIIEDLSTEMDIESLGMKAIRAVMRLTGAKICGVSLLDEDSPTLRYKWLLGEPEELAETMANISIPMDRGVTGSVIRSGRAEIVHDYSHWQQAIQKFTSLSVQSTLSAPIKIGTEVIGVLSVADLYDPWAYQEADIPLVEAVARQVGVAVQRQRLMDKTKRSEAQYRGLVELSPEGIVVHNSDGRIQFANTAAADLMKFDDHSEMVGVSIFEFVLPEYHEQMRTFIEEMLSSGSHSPRVEQVFVDSCGNAVNVEVSATPVLYDDSISILEIFRDVTERKQKELELKLKDNAIASCINGIALSDLKGRLTYVNRSLLDMWGYESEDEVLGRHVVEFCPSTGEPTAALEAVLNTGGWHGEQLGKKKNGEHIDVQLTASLVRDNNGEPLHLFASFIDITEQKQSELDLKESEARLFESEARYRAVFEQAAESIVLIDSATADILEFNERAHENLGYTREEFANLNLNDIDVLESPAETIERTKKILATGGDVFETKHRTKNGDTRDMQISAKIVEIGEKPIILSLWEDITERKQSLDSMQRLSHALRTVGECNKILVHAVSETELLNDICDVLLRAGEYQLAWVGYIQEDEHKTLQTVAVRGEDGGFVGKLQIKCVDTTQVCCNIAKAYQLARPISVGDVLNDPSTLEYRNAAVERGYLSSIALPLKDDQRVFGILTIFANQPHVFDDEAVMLLEEMANDLAYGILAQRSHKERDQAQKALAESEERLRTIITREADGVIVLDEDYSVQFLNPAAKRLFGRDEAEIIGKDFGFPVVTTETTEINIIRPDASIAVAEMRVVETFWGGTPAYVVSIHDISERQLLETERKQSLEQRQAALVQTIRAIALAVEKRDPYTAGHQQRVAQLAGRIAGQLGLDEDRIEGIQLGGMIHDLGKIYIPSEILNRPGRLEPAEFEFIKTHPRVGYDIIKDIEFPWPVAEMVVQHHEMLDGSGYPKGLKGDEIILEARILTVADIVEAMSSHRPYRPALGIEAALGEIKKRRGSSLDAEVVDACVRVVEEKGFVFEGWKT